MAKEDSRYETTEVSEFRGTESKTITAKQEEGWELVGQQQGKLRTTLTFQRPKPKLRWKPLAFLAGAAVVLLGIGTVAAIIEENGSSNPDQSASPPSAAASNDTPAEADPMICETTPMQSTCNFGQTAIYDDPGRFGDTKLEITVAAPVEFRVSDDAVSRYGLELQPVNVYFPVTIKNLSPTPPSGFLVKVTNSQQNYWTDLETVPYVDEGSPSVSSVLDLPLSQTIDTKDGYSMKTLTGVEYKLEINGLAGYDVTFTQ